VALQKHLTAIVCATGCGVAVAGVAVAYSHSKSAPKASRGATATAAAAAKTTAAAGAVTGLGTFAPAVIPAKLNLKPVVVHPRKIVIRKHGAAATVAAPRSNAKSESPWKQDQSGSGSGGGQAPPPPPPPNGPASAPPPPAPPPPPGSSSGGSGGGGGGGSTSGGGGGGSDDGEGGTTRSGNAPRMTSRPHISGGNTAGSTLTVSNGTWSGSTPMTYSYSWTKCNASGCSGAGSAQSYHTTSADVGYTFRCTVTARNSYGRSSATSDTSDRIQAGG
jgi:hypothetical protein